MKKIIALILAIIMCLSLTACGSKMSKEEMLEVAVEIGNYRKELNENQLRAQEKYVGNIYLITGYVSDLTPESIKIDGFTITLSEEDIIKLENKQKVTIVGKVDSLEIVENEEMLGGSNYNIPEPHGIMSNAYVVEDKFDVSGMLLFRYVPSILSNGKTHGNFGEEEHWEVGIDTIDNNSYIVDYDMTDEIPVKHVIGKDIDTVTISGKEFNNEARITVSAKVFYQSTYGIDADYYLKDVEVIS